MNCTESLTPVHLRAVLIESGCAYLCISQGAGRLIPVVDRCLFDFDQCAAAVKQEVDRPLAKPAGDWHDALRRLINREAAA